MLFGTIPSALFTGDTVNKSSLQIVLACALMAGLGLMVITAVKFGPVHVPAIGVTV